LCILFLAAVIAAFGPALGLYRVLFEHVTFLKFIRAPGRSALFAIFAIGVLAAPCFAWIRSVLARVEKPAVSAVFFTTCMFLFLCAEMWTMPIQLIRPEDEISGHKNVVEWLKAHDKAGPVAELPLKPGSDMEAAAMLRMIVHEHPIINGYASFTPRSYIQLKQAISADPSGKGCRLLRAYGARYVVLHSHLMTNKDKDTLTSSMGGETVFSEPGHIIIFLPQQKDAVQNSDILSEDGVAAGNAFVPGRLYSWKLARYVQTAFMVNFRGGRSVKVFSGGRESSGRMDLKINGAVLLDKGDDKLYFKCIRPAALNKAGRAVLVEPPLDINRR
jgi:hypothetical protein